MTSKEKNGETQYLYECIVSWEEKDEHLEKEK